MVAGLFVSLLAGCLPSGQRPPCSTGPGPLNTVCGFHNPEDVEYVQRAGLVLVTNMRDAGRHAAGQARAGTGPEEGGFVAAYEPDDGTVRVLWPFDGAVSADPDDTLGDPACQQPPAAAAFSPHGMTSRTQNGRTLVFVTNHRSGRRGREAVEVFALEGGRKDARLVWKACIPTLGGIQANDIAVTHDGQVVVSNYQPSGSLRFTFEASLFGAKTGDVLVWNAESGWRHVPGTSAALANGVAVSADGQMLFYAESMTGLVHRLPLAGGGGAISVQIEGNPDNLSWTDHGRLLVTSHTAGTRFGLCLLGRRPCETSWAVFEIDPLTLAVRKIFEHDGTQLGAVSSAAQVDGDLVLGSVFDDRIGLLAVR